MARLAPAYAPRRPTETVLYRAVRDHLETFVAYAAETYAAPLPAYVEREFRGYLDDRPIEARSTESPELGGA